MLEIGGSCQLVLKMMAILLIRRAWRRFSCFFDSLPSGIPAEEQCGAPDLLVGRQACLDVPEWLSVAWSGRPSSPPSMFSLFSVCLWSVRDLEGNRGMSAQKECSGPQWPAAVLHSSSATSANFREDFKTLEERNIDQMLLPSTKIAPLMTLVCNV